MEGLIFGGGYVRRKIYLEKSIEDGNLPFFFVLLLFEGNFQVQAPPGTLVFEGLIHGRAYFRNFTVLGYHQSQLIVLIR